MKRLRLQRRRHWDDEVKLFGFFDAQRVADRFVREAATLQEARTLCVLLARRGGQPVFASEDRLRLFQIALSGDALRHGLGDAVRFQVLADAGCAVLARKPVRAGLRVALVGKLLFRNQVPEKIFQGLCRFGVRRQLAGELGAGVLAPREVPERPRLEGDGRVRRVVIPPRRFILSCAWGAARPSCRRSPSRPPAPSRRRPPSRGSSPRSRARAAGSP